VGSRRQVAGAVSADPADDDGALDWMEQLGNAVVAQQGEVMDAIQRLRHQAAAAGTLWSNAQQQVTTER
jgi:hypothetical protein